MAYKSDILLGQITKVSGYEGAVAVKLEKNFPENILPDESVFLEIEGRPVPFFISGYEYSGAGILKLTFEGYDTIEKVSEFIGCRVFLTSGKPEGSKAEEINILVGFSVLVKSGKLLGTIKDIIESPGQWLINITSPENKEILVPFHEDFIVSIDKPEKIMIMDLPEGLTEIN
jgi:16S rRNA processing protein RimM